MYQYIETIRIDNGEICNLSYHTLRLNHTRLHFWPDSSIISLKEYIKPELKEGIIKARVVYGESGIEDISYTPYQMRQIRSLAIVQDNDINYTYKSTNREMLNRLFAQRGTCDDVLIVKQGLLTDTSIANIAFFDGHHWHTPKKPLLKGTKRAQLLDSGILCETTIKKEDVSAFSTVRLFNAMIGWGELELPATALHFTD